MDGDVMHGCSVALEQSMEVSPTMPETENKHIIYSFLLDTDVSFHTFSMHSITL